MTVEPPAWATQVPSAPVQQPTAKAFQFTQLSTAQVEAMQAQLLQSVWQGFLQIVDGFVLPDTTGSEQLAAWWADLQAQFTAFGASLQQSWLNLQNLFNGIVGAVDSDVVAAITWLQNLATDVSEALTTGDFTPLLTLLFGSPVIGTQVLPTALGSVLGGPSLGDDLTAAATALFGAPAVAAITTVENDIANFLSNGISGGSAPTSVNSPVAFLDNLLGINGIPHTSVAIPPSPGSGTITHDAHANATPFNGTPSPLVTMVPWNITPGTTANYLTVRVGFYSNSATFVTATCAGVQLALLDTIVSPNGTTTAQIYGIPNPSTGVANAIQVQLYCPFGLVDIAAATADTLIGVGSVGSTDSNNGSNSSPSLTVPSFTGEYILHAATVESSGGIETLTVTSPAGYTTQYNSGALTSSGGALQAAFLAGDAAGGTSVSFADTALFTTTNQWATVAVNLLPLPSIIIGSGFRQYRSSATAVAASTSLFTAFAFPASFFDTAQPSLSTADYTYVSSTNTLTINHAGWYTFKISSLMTLVVNTSMVAVSGALKINGALLEIGVGSGIGINGVGAQYVASRFNSVFHSVYCSAGDTITPCYYIDGNGTVLSLSLLGSTAGTDTYFGAAVQNRSLM